MLKIKLIIVCLFVFIGSFAQDTTAKLVLNSKIDTTYIKDISDNFIVKINRDTRIDSYKINYNDDSRLDLAPNVSANYSVSLDYKFIGVIVGFPKKWFESDEMNRLKGKTSGMNISFNFFFNKWLQTVRYSSTKGYYVENTSELVSGWNQNTDPYLQLPNLNVQSFGGSTAYIFNGNKFSYRSFLQQTQIQRKSAGSFIPSFQYDYFYRTNISDLGTKDYDKTLSIAAIAGYQYNLIILKNINLSGGIFPGIGLEYSNSNDSNTSQKVKTWNSKIITNLNLNLNYQLKRFFCGIQFSSLNTSIKDDEARTSNAINYGNIYLGYRFNAPKIIQKPINWIEKKIF